MIASAYTAYPNEFKSGVLICLQNFLIALLPMAFFHILLTLSGDVELNPGPKIAMASVEQKGDSCLTLRVLHLTTYYSMQECAICNTTTRYMTTNRVHNDIHG